MNDLIHYFESIDPVYAALLATTFTWLVTAMGASLVFFFKSMHRGVLDGMLGFTGGVMVAASFWSLLNPSIELSERMYPDMIWMPAAVGFLSGALFLFFLDKSLPHLHINFKESEKEGVKTQFHKTTLLVLAITLHNIPEGLAVGVLFGACAHGIEGASIAGAVTLAIGIGIQNFPEGFAVSMPIRRQGVSRIKEFLVWSIICNSRACCCCFRSCCCSLFHANIALCISICSRRYDICCGGGSDPRNSA